MEFIQLVIMRIEKVKQLHRNRRIQELKNGIVTKMVDNRKKNQRNVKPTNSNFRNQTGLPNNLKLGIENLSGYSMDDVRVHYGSSKPAAVQAYAYTQGTDIYVSPGQERHLPHEA